MLYTLAQFTKDCEDYMIKYKEYKEGANHNYHEFQEVRDGLSEAALSFSEEYATLRSNAERGELNRKFIYEQRRIYWRDELGPDRGNAALADSKAFLDCKRVYSLEVEANAAYYRARNLVESVNQLCNSIATRLKIVDKAEYGNISDKS